jgi:hypothetical protein
MKTSLHLMPESLFIEFARSHDLRLEIWEHNRERGDSKRYSVEFFDFYREGKVGEDFCGYGATISEAIISYRNLIEGTFCVLPKKKGQRKRHVIQCPRLRLHSFSIDEGGINDLRVSFPFEELR